MPSLQINEEVTILYSYPELCDTEQAFNTRILSVPCVEANIVITAVIYLFGEGYLRGGIWGREPGDKWGRALFLWKAPALRTLCPFLPADMGTLRDFKTLPGDLPLYNPAPWKPQDQGTKSNLRTQTPESGGPKFNVGAPSS